MFEGIDYSLKNPENDPELVEEKEFYTFDYYLGFATAFQDKQGFVYTKYEEEFLVENAMWRRFQRHFASWIISDPFSMVF